MKLFSTHRHKFVIKGVEHIKTSERAPYPYDKQYWMKPSIPETLILRVCDCGESRTNVQLGTWELEDLS